MINELYPLSVTMKKHNIIAPSYHRKYKPIPKITPKAPCVQFILSSGKITQIRSIPSELGKGLRKYGTNNGTFPFMNLTPLYRISDPESKKILKRLKAENLTQEMIAELRSWCVPDWDNWGKPFLDKYRISMVNMPKEIQGKLSGENQFELIENLIAETNLISDPTVFRAALESALFDRLEQKVDIDIALKILFQIESDKKSKKDPPANLSVAFDSERLIEAGIPAVSDQFVKAFNQKLMQSETAERQPPKADSVDAFGIKYNPIKEKMPSVKLAGGFEAKLRTMFNAHHCQYRYGKIEDQSYPISPELRTDLQTALNWIGSADHFEETWVKLGEKIILFVYPHTLPKIKVSFTKMFKSALDEQASFETEAERFITNLKQTHVPGADSNADRIQFFILRKIDRARTKIVYSKVSNAPEMEKLSEAWTLGCQNLPQIARLRPRTLFPARVPSILNRVWKLDGTIVTDKFRPVPEYHGVELLLDTGIPTDQDLHMAVQGSINLIPYIGIRFFKKNDNAKKPADEDKAIYKVSDQLSLFGLLLYRIGIRKENYMEDFPYLYGQLLKISDELHALYCRVVRNGDLPPQLAGSSIYPSAVETPIRTLNVLAQRMNPYITWAKTYQYKNVAAEGSESWKAKWLISLYEKNMTKLYTVWNPETRFNDAEKAQLFIGFLAAFPKRESTTDSEPAEEVTE